MVVEIHKSHASGQVFAPPSKSYAHRLLIAAALAKGTSIIRNVELSEDILATLNGLKALGATYMYDDKTITISGITNFKEAKKVTIDANESGSTLRFLIPVSLVVARNITFRGSKTLMSRGITVYENIFDRQKIEYKKTPELLNLKGHLTEDEFIIDGTISTQFITGLLFSLPLLKKDSKIIIVNGLESKDYVNITIDVLQKFGIEVSFDCNQITIKGNQVYHPGNFEVEGDYSNAAFLDALNYLNGNVIIDGLNKNSIQGDKSYIDYFKAISVSNVTLDIANCVDLGPVLMMMAAFFHGATLIGTKRLAIKESNRALAMKEELEKMGANIKILENQVIIAKEPLKAPNCLLNSHNDHRIVMSLAILLTRFGGKIAGSEAVKKSFPTFFAILEKLGVDLKYEINK